MTFSDAEPVLAAIAAALPVQDNAITAEPIFCVQQRRRIYGFDSDEPDEYVWLHADECDEVEPDEASRLEASFQRSREEPTEYIRTAYVDRWETVQPFFTRAGAERFIASNKHNYAELRLYVESAHRNPEWQAVRAALLEMHWRATA